MENPSNRNIKFKVLHVPIQDVIGMLSKHFSLEELESIEHMQANRQQIQAAYVIRIIKAAENTFTSFKNLYYDSLTEQIIIDNPSMFMFNMNEGAIEANNNKKPFKYVDL